MTALAKLKLVSVSADRKSPTIWRRNKLNQHLTHQISLAKDTIAGDVFTAKTVKFVTNQESGVREPVEISKQVKPWWFTTPAGKIALTLKYGSKPLEIIKGKNAVETADMDDLVATLEVIKAAVNAGELDAQIEQTTRTVRAGFAKGKKA